MAKPTKILLLHGGAWTGTTGAVGMYPIRDELRANGLDADSPEYFTGLAYRLEIPAQVAAVQAMTNTWHAAGYRVVLYGGSSGGHIALCLAARGEVEGCVAFVAPTNLVGATLYGLPLDAYFADPQMQYDYSPINRLLPGVTPSPTLLLHGDLDPVVALSHSQQYLQLAYPLQPDTSLEIMEGVMHDVPVAYWPVAREWIQQRLDWPAPTDKPREDHPLSPCGKAAALSILEVGL